MAIDALALTMDLIRCQSVTPADDGALDVVADALAPLGFGLTRLPFGEIDNLFARLGRDGPHLCFCGHTDVVPPGDVAAWTSPPFDPVVRDGILYGRGAADMKGNIACFIAALSAYIEAHGQPQGSVSLLITGDEEGAAVDGTVKVLGWMNDNGQLADDYLVGEPSNPQALGDEIKIGRRGSLSGRLDVRGIQGHVAYPDRADNPLPKLVRLLDRLSVHRFDEGSDHFPPTNLEITTIDTGNTADNVIPASVSARFNVRFNDRWTAAALEAAIHEILDRENIAYRLDCSSNAEAFLTSPGKLSDTMAQAVSEITGRRPAMTTGGGTSDARFAAAYGPVIESGLVNRSIHQVDEHVPVTDLEQLTLIYRRFLELYFG